MKKIICSFVCVFAIFAFGNNANADLNDGLVAYYPFDNYAIDETGNGHDGTVYSATRIADRNGKPNSAYSFDGVNDYIKIPHHIDLNFNDNFSIAFWVNSDNLTGVQILLAKGRDCLSGYFFGFNGPNGFNLSYSDQWCKTRSVGTSVPRTEWHHVTVTVDNINLKMSYYLDGTFIREADIYSFFTNNTFPLVLGRHFTCANGGCGYEYHWSGDLDELRLYDRTLSETEVVELYNFGVPQASPLTFNTPLLNQILSDATDEKYYNFTLTEDTTVALVSTGNLDLQGELFELVNGELEELDADNDSYSDEGDRRINYEFADAIPVIHDNFMLRPGADDTSDPINRILHAGTYYLKVTDDGSSDFNETFGVILLKRNDDTKVEDFFDGLEAIITDGDTSNDYLDIYVRALFADVYDSGDNWGNALEYGGVIRERQCKALANFFVRYVLNYGYYFELDSSIYNLSNLADNDPSTILQNSTMVYNAEAYPEIHGSITTARRNDVFIDYTNHHIGIFFDDNQEILDANFAGPGKLGFGSNVSITAIVRP